jgi:lauroyl/myristoyl acyltransferase/mitochondrial fission protein ELM1
MNKDSIIDYCSCILFKLFGPLIRRLPPRAGLFLGATLGELLYYIDKRHKSIAYSNIKTAFASKLSLYQISHLTKEFYRTFGQNLVEIFFIPLINKEYINKYISIEGLDYIREGFKKGKGVIILGVHEGGWELSNILCVNLGFPFRLFIRDQRYPRLNKLLNFYRSQKGCKLILRKNQTRQLIEALKNNEAIGMTADQGGKTGTLVKFFGQDASMASGAIRLALRYDATLLFSFYIRQKGPYIKIIIEPAFKIIRTKNKKKDIQDNLQRAINIFEKYILKYPKEYLWSYKIWKYSKEKKVLILSDGKTGHIRQSEAVADIISGYLNDKGTIVNIDTIEVIFKNKFSRYTLAFSSYFSGKFQCQGCLWCLKGFLKEDNYNSLIRYKPDIVISCGSSIAPINFIISRENLAKSVVIMRPSVLSTKRFDLVIMPQHDGVLKRKNVIVSEGALNSIDQDYLVSCKDKLSSLVRIEKKPVIGLLVGGDAKSFNLNRRLMGDIVKEIKIVLDKLDGQILITTSRRTSKEIESLLKEEFREYPRCKFLVIANEKNIPDAVGGILALSNIVIVSPESISMISEAASSNRYIIVFKARVNHRHNSFLNYMAGKKYIYLCQPDEISSVTDNLWRQQPTINIPRDKAIVEGALKRIL